MALKIIKTHRESSFKGRMETQRISDSDGRERRILELTNECHELRRIDRSFRRFEEI
jgi:hypothetical protein